jgi:hypothetical protein
MFSGGVDSTLVAALMLEKFKDVFLITFEYGAELFIGRSSLSVVGLRKRFGLERVHHNIVGIEKWWRENQIRHAREFNLVCMTCKFIMHTRAICYCLENGIFFSSDGSIKEQGQHPEQMVGSLKILTDYYREYTVNFTSPVYELSQEEEDSRLEGMGINMGKRLTVGDAKGSHVHRQALCLFAFFDVLFSNNKYFPIQEEKVIEHLKNDLSTGRSLINEYFAGKGIDLGRLLKERERVYNEITGG